MAVSRFELAGRSPDVYRALARLPDNTIRSDVAVGDLDALRSDPHTKLWVDLSSENGVAGAEQVLKRFGFHPLAIDDALRHTHVPKVDDWREYLYIVTNAVELDTTAWRVCLHELDIFVGRNYLVTYRTAPIAALDRLWEVTSREPRRLARGTDNLLYQLLDAIVADYLPIAERLDEWIDRLENKVFARPTPATLSHIFQQKRVLIELRRSLSGLREVLNRLARDEYKVIDRRDQVYFRDVYDHLVRLYEIVESLRDLVSSSLDIYLSAISNRTNEIMKALTVVTVQFLPLSFLAGFFGMNYFGEDFAIRPSMSSTVMFWASLTIMLLLPPAMYLWMKRRRWL
jgi:magnesium transporter